ncbi:hypothetical protein OHA40_24725 [Nocardia sp. NBC_00508]|uniref:hypothetical protein n=1 Tax=Nocardia sp. NBC_00508 TaxID=2975992 RepID=UPI002E80A934|nr:hypothetical protein [Nocardia sp. NBC_00508]WUD64859.1 hypothetical protein OHA40_24725 [Nocardia sp. NBC_00508]
MLSTTSAARRKLARVAVAGAIAAIPLTALAMPASANPSAPAATEVRYDPWYDRCAFGPFQNWSCNNNPLFGWWGGPADRYRQDRPPGLFGSS